MSETQAVMRALERMMRSRMTYLAVTAGFLFYFTINYSQAGLSLAVIESYAGLLGLGTLIYLYVLNSRAAGQDLEPKIQEPITGKATEQRWDVMAGMGALALFGTITFVAVLQRMTDGAPTQIEPGLVWPNLIEQAFVVVTAETLIFQMMLPEVIRRTSGVAPATSAWYLIYYGGSQVIFAAMHFTAYGGNFQQMAFVMAFGCLLLYVCDRWGAAAAWGIHLGWNLMVLGIILGA